MAARVRLSFVRRNSLAQGTRARVRTNGTFASNGDLIPPLNLSNPLTTELTSVPIEVWPQGKAGLGTGPAGVCPVGRPGNYLPGYGVGQGLLGVGEVGLYGDYFTFDTPVARDGTYKFSIVLEDEQGTVQTEPEEEVTVTVAGPPRPPSGLEFTGWDGDGGTIGLAWAASPDIS